MMKKCRSLLVASSAIFSISLLTSVSYAYDQSNPPVVDLSHDLHSSQYSDSQTSQQVAAADLAPPQQSDPQQYQDSTEDGGDDSASSGYTEVNPSNMPSNTNEQQPAMNQDLSSVSPVQRLSRVEQQVQNLVNLGMPQQITQLQQQVQQLTGEMEQQQHDLGLLKKQLEEQSQQLKATSKLSSSSNNNASVGSADDSAADLPSDDVAYQNALSLLNKKQYKPAEAAFKQYIQHYPTGKFAVNAHYWLGELYSAEGNPISAATEFTWVVSNYPNSDKAGDAKLKLAMIHIQQGKISLARQELQQIQTQFPESAAAHLANIQLKQLDLSN